MPITRSILEDKGFNNFNRREEYSVPLNQEIPLSSTNQEIPNKSIDFSKLTIDYLYINQNIGSSGFITGVAGWIIMGNGTAEFNNVTVRGTIYASTGQIGGWYINTNTLSSGAVEDDSNVLIDSANSLLRLGPTSGNYITVDGANQRIRSGNYISGMSGQGFSLDSDLLEIGNISARGTIRTANFQKDVISSIAGGQVISPNSAVLSSDVATSDTTITITSDSSLSEGEVLRIKEGIQDEYMFVADNSTAPTYKVVRNMNGATRLASLDSLTADGGTWTGGGGAVNLSVVSSGMREGSGCIQFDTDSSFIYPYIYTNITSIDLSSYFGVSRLYSWLYISDLTGFNYPQMLLAISTTSGVSIPGYKVDGGSYEIGWNLVYFSLLDINYGRWVGDLDTSAITRIYLQILQDPASTVSGYRYDGLWIRKVKTPETNRIHYWPFYEGTGTNAMDYGHSGINSGTITNGSWVTGHGGTGYALSFVGTGYVDMGNPTNLQFERTDDFSISFWFKTSSSSDMTIISKGIVPATYRGYLVNTSSGNMAFQLISTVSTDALTVSAAVGTLADDNWHHCVTTYDGTSDVSGVHIYIDGSDKALTTVQNNLTSTILNAYNFRVGARGTGLSPFTGSVDEIKVYDKVLTQVEVTALYTSGTSAGLTDIANYEWKKGATVVDYGVDGSGVIYSTASDTASPYMDIMTHTGTPWTSSTNTTEVRVGNLSGITDSDFGGALTGYGIYTTNGYFKGTVDVGTIGKVKGGQSAYATGTGFWIGYDGGIYKFSIGNATSYFKYDGSNVYLTGALTATAPIQTASYTVANLPVPLTSSGPNSPSSTS